MTDSRSDSFRYRPWLKGLGCLNRKFARYWRRPPSIRAKAIDYSSPTRQASNSRRSNGLPTATALLGSFTRDYRVLGVLANDIVIWFWIGSHDNYERLIRELRLVVVASNCWRKFARLDQCSCKVDEDGLQGWYAVDTTSGSCDRCRSSGRRSRRSK
jgi:hypothetical protein